VLGTPDDPKLAAASVDAVLLLKVYHEIAHPTEVMKRVRARLRPGGKVRVIDRNGNGTDHGWTATWWRRRCAGQATSSREDTTSQRRNGEDYFLIFIAKYRWPSRSLCTSRRSTNFIVISCSVYLGGDTGS
jgi:hypothetical protein